MAKQQAGIADPKVGDAMFYYATGNQPDEPFSGPYIAKVVKVTPAVEAVDGAKPSENHPGSPLTVDLDVRFSDSPTTHRKTGVKVSAAPKLHHASPAPSAIDFDSWIREVEKSEPEKP